MQKMILEITMLRFFELCLTLFANTSLLAEFVVVVLYIDNIHIESNKLVWFDAE